MKEHLKISNFLQFEGHSSKSFIFVIWMIDSWGENTGIIQKNLSKLVFLYSFNSVLGLLDELLELLKRACKTWKRG